MDTPNSKTSLLNEMNSGRSAWEELLSKIPQAAMRETGVEGVWSVRDIVAHICAYQQYMAAMLQDMKENGANATSLLDSYYQMHLTMYRGEHPELPEHLQDVRGDQVNEVFTAAYRYKTTGEILSMEAQAYQKLLKWVNAFSEEELTQTFANTGKTLLQVIPRQSHHHYLQHIPAIQAWLDRRSAETEHSE